LLFADHPDVAEEKLSRTPSLKSASILQNINYRDDPGQKSTLEKASWEIAPGAAHVKFADKEIKKEPPEKIPAVQVRKAGDQPPRRHRHLRRVLFVAYSR
jgi:hypothetical protein